MIPNEYTTERELSFVKGLSLNGHSQINQNNPRKALSGYIQAAKARQDWDNMDGDAIIAYAEKLLEGVK